MELQLPASRTDLMAVQRQRKKQAFIKARQSSLLSPRLTDIDLNRIDDPVEWQKIPLLNKDDLRKLSSEEFYQNFCLDPVASASELWRSGGSTGRPLFYPRSSEDMQVAMLSFERVFAAIGASSPVMVHNSLPFGTHPAGQLFSRAAERQGLSVLWAGAGNTTSSAAQVDLLKEFQPGLWIGMASYALHLANLALASGVDPKSFGVEKILCTAEPLSQGKRERIGELWGARVYDCLGMTEISMLGAEVLPGQGFRLWTDLVYEEVLDQDSLKPVTPGEIGTLVVTSLATNNITPFLRWNTGDMVSIDYTKESSDRFSVFPLMRHAHRTSGFVKVRGINIGHTDFEDLMFENPELTDFRIEVINEGGIDILKLRVEIQIDQQEAAIIELLKEKIRKVFEVDAEIVIEDNGTTARFFESQVKAQRFIDKRDMK